MHLDPRQMRCPSRAVLLQEELRGQPAVERRGSGGSPQRARSISGASASALGAEGRRSSPLPLSSPLTSLTIPEVTPHGSPAPVTYMAAFMQFSSLCEHNSPGLRG